MIQFYFKFKLNKAMMNNKLKIQNRIDTIKIQIWLKKNVKLIGRLYS